MSKVLVMDYQKCVGCLTCVQACSVKQAGVINCLLSRVQVVKLQMGIANIPLTCAQCVSAPCAELCPIKAIHRDELLGRLIINYEACIGCRMCMTVCPFACMSFNSEERRVFKCELCDGDPTCVKFCQHDALQYVEASEQETTKRTAVAEKLSGIVHKIASAMGTNDG